MEWKARHVLGCHTPVPADPGAVIALRVLAESAANKGNHLLAHTILADAIRMSLSLFKAERGLSGGDALSDAHTEAWHAEYAVHDLRRLAREQLARLECLPGSVRVQLRAKLRAAAAGEAVEDARRACDGCGAGPGLMLCCACRRHRFCSHACQRDHWPEMRARCKALRL